MYIKTLIDLDAIPIFMDCFENSPKCNFLHHQITQLLCQFLSAPSVDNTVDIVHYLANDANIYDFIGRLVPIAASSQACYGG